MQQPANQFLEGTSSINPLKGGVNAFVLRRS